MVSEESSRSRRAEIRRHRPDVSWIDWARLRSEGGLASLGIAAAFCVAATAILMLRQDVVPYRAGQWVSHDILSRVAFSYTDKELLARKRREAAEHEPRIYSPGRDMWGDIHKELLELPDRIRKSHRRAARRPSRRLRQRHGDRPAPLPRHRRARGDGSTASTITWPSVRNYRIPGGNGTLPIYRASRGRAPARRPRWACRAHRNHHRGGGARRSPTAPTRTVPRDQRRMDELRDILDGDWPRSSSA